MFAPRPRQPSPGAQPVVAAPLPPLRLLEADPPSPPRPPPSGRSGADFHLDPRDLHRALAALPESQGTGDGAARSGPASGAGWRIPGGRHISQAGRQEILRQRALQPRPAIAAIADELGLSQTVVQGVAAAGAPSERRPETGRTADSPSPEVSPGMRTPRGHGLSAKGRARILALHAGPRPLTQRAIAKEVGVSQALVNKVIKPKSKRTDAAASAQSRPIVNVANWNRVMHRGWNAGDRFRLIIDDLPALFEVTRDRQPGETMDPRDFRPIIRGG